jgi:hypothetical protein
MPPPKPAPLTPRTTGLAAVDALSASATPALAEYLSAVSEYIQASPGLSASVKKTAQIALSAGLGRCLKKALEDKLPRLHAFAGELDVAGALRTARADVSESHSLDGLRLAVEIKPVNLAVGRAIWNRFGDIRAFAVNIHLKFPFAVVGGVLVVPTWEWSAGGGSKVPTLHLIDRLVRRLQRTRRRETEADAPHLLEAITVVVFDPDTGHLNPVIPPPGYDLRWDEFVTVMTDTYDIRFD